MGPAGERRKEEERGQEEQPAKDSNSQAAQTGVLQQQTCFITLTDCMLNGA